MTLYDFGLHEGSPYSVMEYLEGKDLQQVMAAPEPLQLLDNSAAPNAGFSPPSGYQTRDNAQGG